MNVLVLFLGPAKDASGAESKRLKLSEGSRLADLRELIAQQNPSLQRSLQHMRFAINEEFADGSRPIHDGDIVALIPPVSGG